MKAWSVIASLVVLGTALALIYYTHVRRRSTHQVIHVENGFEFTIHAPYKSVFPLFGAHGEHAWAGEAWDPRFLHPQPAEDMQGEVFQVAHGHTHATWINTAFDPDSGHVQYTYVIPDVQAVLIDIHLREENSSTTEVKVLYERTSLTSSFNERILEMGRRDSESGSEWRKAIETCLGIKD